MQTAVQFSPDGFWMWNGTQWVPNPYRQPALAVSARPYEPADFRATMTTLFLAVNMFGVILLLVFDILDAASVQEGSPHDALLVAVGLVALLGLIMYYGSLIPTVVFFCMWLHRVVRNMPSLGSRDPRWTPGGAVGRCFIPFLNLVHPMVSVLDAWRGSVSTWLWLDEGMRRTDRVPGLIAGWWAAWLLARFGSVIGNFIGRGNDTGAKLTGIGVDAVSQLLMIAAAVLAIFVVRGLTARQNLKHHLISSGQLV